MVHILKFRMQWINAWLVRTAKAIIHTVKEEKLLSYFVGNGIVRQQVKNTEPLCGCKRECGKLYCNIECNSSQHLGLVAAGCRTLHIIRDIWIRNFRCGIGVFDLLPTSQLACP